MAKRVDASDMVLAIVPWWVFSIAGVIVFIIAWALSVPQKTPDVYVAIGNGLNVIISMFLNIVGGILELLALILLVKSLGQRALLESQYSLESIRNISWQQFEQLVGEAYRRQGYTVIVTGGGGADGGVDLVLRRNDRLTVVQCKRWKTRQIKVNLLYELLGVMTANHADACIFVTSGTYTRDALAFAEGKPMTLVDGEALLRLIRTVQTAPVPVTASPTVAPARAVPVVSPTAPVCAKCGAAMVLRTAKKGPNPGEQFWGCANYPRCRGTHAVTAP